MKKSFRCLVAGMALCVSGWLHAGVLVQYSYTDPDGQTKTAEPQTAAVNPVGNVSFILAAGIDRRVRIALFRGGTQLASATSEPLTADDRITVGGNSYYAATLVLPAPAVDGNHTLRAEILDHEGTLITHESLAVIIDRQAPVLSGGMGYLGMYGKDPLETDDLVSFYGVARIIARGVADAHAGIATEGSRFQTLYQEGPNSGQVATDQPALFADGDVFVGSGSNHSVVRPTYLPTWDGALLLRFRVPDRAGNVATFDMPVVYDGQCDGSAVELLAVYNPASSANPVPGSPYLGYEPYTPGMTAHTNPVKLLVRVPKAVWWEFNPTGIMLHDDDKDPWPTPADYSDANYVYKTYAFSYRPLAELPEEGLSPTFRVAAPLAWGCAAPKSIYPDLILAADVPPSPILTDAAVEYATAGPVAVATFPHGHRGYPSHQVDTLSRVTLSAEARPYDQIGKYKGFSCGIPAGATSCSVTPNVVLGDTADGMEQYQAGIRITNSDNTLLSPYVERWHLHDTRPPVISGVTEAADHSQLDVRLTEYMSGAWLAKTVEVTRVWGVATPTGGGTAVPLAHTTLRSLGGDNWQAYLPLSAVPEGTYDITVHAEDYVGNQATPTVIEGINIDRTAPSAAFFVAGGAPLGSDPVTDIGNIYFKVTDAVDPAPQVLAVRIAGGPLDDDVSLSFYPSFGVYRIEYPIMLPSLEEDDYTILVDMRDASGNTYTAQQAFTYGPPVLGLTPENGPHIRLPLLAESVAVRLDNNNWPLTSDKAVLIDAGGQPITGSANLVVSWSADALGTLLVDGQPLAAGARLTIANYDFDRNASRIQLPLALADSSGLDAGWVGDLIIVIVRPEAPTFLAAVHAWSPATAITLASDATAYARKVQPATLTLADSGEEHCGSLEGLMDVATQKKSGAEDGTSRCAVHWSDLPAALEMHPLYSWKVQGYLDSPESMAQVGYQPGMTVVSAGVVRFIPSGAAQIHTVPLYDPTPPEVTYGPTSTLAPLQEWLPDGLWPTITGPAIAGVARAKSTPNTGLTLRITDEASGTVQAEVVSASDYARSPVNTNLAHVEDKQTLQLHAHYTRYPEIFTTTTLHFLALPDRLSMNLLYPSQLNNLEPVVLDGYFGEYANGAYRYDAEAMGSWRLQVNHVYSDETGAIRRTALGTPTTAIAPDGRFQLSLGMLEPGRWRLEVTATFLGDELVLEDTIEATPLTIVVNDGTPVGCLITPNVPHGPPKTVAILTLSPDNRRYGDISAVDWERSTDQVQWSPLTATPPKPRAYGFYERLTEPGHYYYRATTTNRYSGRQATCTPAHLQIFDQPEFTLAGPTFTVIDHPVTWTTETAADSPPLEYRWKVRRGLHDETPLTGAAASLELPADVMGTWYLSVEARFATAPDTPRAWAAARGILRVQAPRIATPRIGGERLVELGKSYTYTAYTYPIANQNFTLPEDLYISGEWELPDGTLRTGDTLTYTPSADEQQTLTYRAWINGYREETEREATLTLRPWVYEFPTFTLSSKTVRYYDPLRKQYTVKQSQSVTGKEDFTFTWDFPDTAQVEQPHERYATVSFPTEGEATVSVRVSDTRGNAVELGEVVTVAAPPALTASTRSVIGDSWNRAPAPVTVYWYVSGLLTQERVTTARLTLDDTLMGQGLSSYYRKTVTEPGDHTVNLYVETNYGRTATHTSSVSLVAGEPPTCDLVPTGDGRDTLKVLLDCEVPMGRVAKYRWRITYADAPNEPEDPGMSSYKAISFNATQLARGVNRVEGVAINDKGQESAAAIWEP